MHEPRCFPKLKGLFKCNVPTTQVFAFYGSIQEQAGLSSFLGLASSCGALNGYLKATTFQGSLKMKVMEKEGRELKNRTEAVKPTILDPACVF